MIVCRSCFVAVVVAALQSPHAVASAEVLKQSLRAIVNLAAGNAANCTQLGELGACAGACYDFMAACNCFSLIAFLGCSDVALHRGLVCSTILILLNIVDLSKTTQSSVPGLSMGFVLIPVSVSICVGCQSSYDHC